jgi:serine phosphatase RsbU (regulator of sigma subunit)
MPELKAIIGRLRFRTSPALTALGGAVLLLLVWSFVVLSGKIDGALAYEDGLQAARGMVATIERLQLDEETAVRGYALTHKAAFLQPYEAANPDLEPTFTRLEDLLDKLDMQTAASQVRNAESESQTWHATTAHQLLTQTMTRPQLLQNEVRGRALMDGFRAYMGDVSTRLSDRIGRNRVSIEDTLGSLFVLDLAAIGGFALIVTVALLRERVSERNAYLVRRLQEVFAPADVPEADGIAFSCWYQAASDGVNVGGDWYSALWLDGDRILFVVGDVMGHGLDAAIAMGRSRQSVLTLAMADLGPVDILHLVNRVMLQQDLIVTMVVGIVTVSTREVVYSIAGHPPPILVSSDGDATLLATDGVPLGISDTAIFTRFFLKMQPGMRLVLYTDGLVEFSRNLLDGESAMLTAARDLAAYTDWDIAERVAKAVVGSGPVRDDVAILTLSCLRGRSENASHPNVVRGSVEGGEENRTPLTRVAL